MRIKKGILVAVTGILVLLGFFAWIMHSQLGITWGKTAQDLLLIVSSVVAGLPIARKAFSALRYRAFSIDLLVTIAVVGALIIGEYVESAVVSFLFLFGDWLEARSLERTRESVRNLVDSAPTTARLLKDGQEVEVSVDDIEIGDILIVKSGDSVPVDGNVMDGTGYLAQAAITGEPVPVEKTVGDEVYAGTTLENGFLQVSATQVGDDTTFARIIELVEDAQDAKAPRQRFLDKFASIYTPLIIVAAIVFGLITQNVRLALTFLVIACPGALVIATPVAMVAGLGNGAGRGVIIKGGDAMERLRKVDTIVLDKTGTLTQGHPELTGMRLLQGSQSELLGISASLELASEHPLARSIVNAAREQQLQLSDPIDVEVVRGMGLEGFVAGRKVVIGSQRALEGLNVASEHIEAAHAAEETGSTVSWVIVDNQVLGFLEISDDLRPGVRESMEALHRGGVKRLVMLTGDNPRAAKSIAERAGVDEVFAQLLPEGKVTHVDRLKAEGGNVAMVGDGLNDAPALASADVGIAMGAGTDVSVETADVVLAGNRLDQLVHAHRLSKKTVNIMTENTVIALLTVAVLISGVVFGIVNMSIGMLVHEASVLAVIINALRLVNWQPRDFDAQKVSVSKPAAANTDLVNA